MTARMQVAQIPEGSVVVLTGFSYVGDLERDDPDGDYWQQWVQDLYRAFEKVCGHNRFVVLHDKHETSGIEVWGPGTDLEEKVRELLAKKDRRWPDRTWTVGGDGHWYWTPATEPEL